ncbi:MAG: peptide deformylase [Bacteroidota bacterium]
MILPIVTYGTPVLREETTTVESDSPELQALIDDMIETMHNAPGIGLAAPQVGRTERLFVADISPPEGEEPLPDLPEIAAAGPMVFINPEIIADEEGEETEYEEGCLSIPGLYERVVRPDHIRVRYLDRHFEPQEIDATGLLSRVIQHETDHLDGVLFIDLVSPLKRRLLRRRLRDMSRGNVEADYPVSTP